MPNPIFAAGLTYLRVLTIVLALVGVASVAAMQTGLLSTSNPAFAAVDGDGFSSSKMVVAGTTTVRSDFITVDTSQRYNLSARVRVISRTEEQFSESAMRFGIALFDGERKPLNPGWSNVRFGGSRDITVNSLQGWVTLRGSFSGEGDDGWGQFRPGTRFVKVYLSPNRDSDDSSIEVSDVEFTQLIRLEE